MEYKRYAYQGLPKFIYIFSLFFCLLGLVILISLPFNANGNYYIYGMKGLKGSLIGNFIIAILLFKAFVAYSLLTNRSYAIPIAKIDAISGIVIFLVATVLPFITYDPQHPNYRSFGFDILFLIPYLNTICKMKGWNLVKEE